MATLAAVASPTHHTPHSFLVFAGYFPTYTLGAMFATQIFREAEAQLPGLADDISAGEFARLKGWLNEKIHR